MRASTRRFVVHGMISDMETSTTCGWIAEWGSRAADLLYQMRFERTDDEHTRPGLETLATARGGAVAGMVTRVSGKMVNEFTRCAFAWRT